MEIEAFRTLAQVIRRYVEKDSGKKPLSIGVFGPPGAGKSFAVEQIAKNLVKNVEWREFNLSQFNDPVDLIGAFHQIRDHVLQGKLPVAFFDEFDSQNFKWLQYLLAPMQDGKFQEGQLTHTLGKCLFVFAGGTSPTYDAFGPPETSDKDGMETELRQKFRLAKGPDFKSRIEAYLDVLGPNQRQILQTVIPEDKRLVEKISGRDFIIDQSDIVFPVRRALMIRAQLKCGTDDKLEMDEGLIHALLHVEKYIHGNRSLEKILQPFAAAQTSSLHSSLLMPLTQLCMYTDGKAFISFCSSAPKLFSPEAPLTKVQIEKIAPAIHETYCELEDKKDEKKPKTNKDFESLNEFFKNSNLAAATRMLKLMAIVGLTLENGIASEEEENSVRHYLEYYLLALADAEHEEWMEWHFSQGWHYNKDRINEKKLHPCLLPFSKLTDPDKEKDRNAIRHFPDFVRKADMKIIFQKQL